MNQRQQQSSDWGREIEEFIVQIQKIIIDDMKSINITIGDWKEENQRQGREVQFVVSNDNNVLFQDNVVMPLAPSENCGKDAIDCMIIKAIIQQDDRQRAGKAKKRHIKSKQKKIYLSNFTLRDIDFLAYQDYMSTIMFCDSKLDFTDFSNIKNIPCGFFCHKNSCRSINFEGVTLTQNGHAILGCDFNSANMKRSQWNWTVFDQCVFDCIDAQDACFDDCIFNLKEAMLVFKQANLKNTSFRNSGFLIGHNCDVNDIQSLDIFGEVESLIGADFDEAYVSDEILDPSNLDKAR